MLRQLSYLYKDGPFSAADRDFKRRGWAPGAFFCEGDTLNDYTGNTFRGAGFERTVQVGPSPAFDTKLS